VATVATENLQPRALARGSNVVSNVTDENVATRATAGSWAPVINDDPVMGRARAVTGSVAFLLIAPGVVAGLIPWLLTGWEAETWWAPLRVFGGLMIGQMSN
jgi:hypothetical protein